MEKCPALLPIFYNCIEQSIFNSCQRNVNKVKKEKSNTEFVIN